MELVILIDYLIISIIASMAINFVFRNFAKEKAILIDLPDRSRKFHARPTPLVGGLSIFIAVILSGKLYMDLNNLNGYMPNFSYQLIISSIPLLFIFLLDDIKGIKPSVRLVFQILLTMYMIFSTDIYLSNLGNLFGSGNFNLGILSIPVTVFCVVGVMNAFNMIDGINGLCAGCAMLALLFIGFYSGFIYDSMLVLVIGSMIGFLIFNLRVFGKKRGVFLGDSGSNLIGFWVAWVAIYCSQNQLYNVEPITMIWFIAIPFLDCIGLIFTRLKNRISISSPGRDHIHHNLMKRFSSEGTLGIILAVSTITSFFAVYVVSSFPAWVSTILFAVYASAYYLFNIFYLKNYGALDKDV
jgi:UDP-GlcNAc:undecaprenyl-phosphate/decaprenyl-phosphate GlcNAc-1-phosphate transferase